MKLDEARKLATPGTWALMPRALDLVHHRLDIVAPRENPREYIASVGSVVCRLDGHVPTEAERRDAINGALLVHAFNMLPKLVAFARFALGNPGVAKALSDYDDCKECDVALRDIGLSAREVLASADEVET